jgi:glucose/arabinose dehydrogenase
VRGRRAGLLVLLVALASGLSGCIDFDETESTGGENAPPAEPTDAGEPTGAAAEDPHRPTVLPAGPWAEAPLRLELIAEVPDPVALSARSGTDDLYVADRSGQIWRIDRQINPTTWVETWQLQSRPVLDLRDEVLTDDQRGVAGLAFSSDGRSLYVSYADAEGHATLEAFDMGDTTADRASRRVLLHAPQPFAERGGTQVVLGPDGFLYWGLGDGGGPADPLDVGQDPGSPLGTVLRIDPFPRNELPYGIPTGNPFEGGEGGAPEVWLWGVQDPWRFSFDRSTGDLWLTDRGQHGTEEINLLTTAEHRRGMGANLGWSAMEGFDPVDGAVEPEDHHRPLLSYGREAGACAVVGGHVYRGSLLTALDGVFVYGDRCTGDIRAAAVADDGVAEGMLTARAEPGALVSFGEDAGGELYVLEATGRVSRLTVDTGTEAVQ